VLAREKVRPGEEFGEIRMEDLFFSFEPFRSALSFLC